MNNVVDTASTARRSSRVLVKRRLSITENSPKPIKSSRPQKKINNFDEDFLFSNSKSCLSSANLQNLVNGHTWELLTAEQQAVCRSLLPDVDLVKSESGITEIKHDFFNHNIFLQDALREFQTTLADGRFRPAHLKKLAKASRDRTEGKADKFKDEQYEE